MKGERIWSRLGAALAICITAFFAISASAVSHETVLHTFNSIGSDGIEPFGRLTFDAAGNAYGATIGGGAYNFGTVFELMPKQGGGWTKKILYNFRGGADGSLRPVCNSPVGQDSSWVLEFCSAGVIFDHAGNLYGAAPSGGAYGTGVVFELSPTPSGEWTETVLYAFLGNNDGANPNGDLVFDAAGNLYGTTDAGGTNYYGTIFQLTPTQGGWTENILYNFTGYPDGDSPNAGLIFDRAGNLYGTASGLRAGGNGTVFKLIHKNSSWVYSILYSFHGDDGAYPEGRLVSGPDGALYGTTAQGGSGNGVVFRLAPPPTFCRAIQCPWVETVLHSFAGGSADGASPLSEVIFDNAGNLYGTTDFGGAYNYGTVYQLTRSGGGWTESVLHSFNQDGTDAGTPDAGLVLDSAGKLYGTAVIGGSYGDGAVFSLTKGGGGNWTETVEYSFLYNGTDGATPRAGLIFDGAGNLYGTTSDGGAYDHGAVFELSPAQGGGWNEQLLLSFKSLDGCAPRGTLTRDVAGSLYGTALSCGANRWGAVYKLTPTQSGSWTETVLYSFTAGVDGQYPCSGVIFDHAGNLYGATAYGGSYGLGTVFQLTPSQSGWTERVIYSFDNTHGDNEYCGSSGNNNLTLDAAGNLYGTTAYGGAHGRGAAFKLSPSQGGNWTQTALYSFGASQDGYRPYAGLIFDVAGNLYGTTSSGGTYGRGTAFQLTPNFTENVLYSFGASPDGYGPTAALAFDAAGNLYGTSVLGGDYGGGTVFKLTPGQGGSWTESVVYSFNLSIGDGSSPRAEVIFDAAGNLYGTTSNLYRGTVFQITP